MPPKTSSDAGAALSGFRSRTATPSGMSGRPARWRPPPTRTGRAGRAPGRPPECASTVRSPSARAPDGSSFSTGRMPAGNLVSGNSTAPRPSRTRYSRFAAASVASARRVPAISSASPLKAAVPASSSSGTQSAAAGLASGLQPSSAPIASTMATCATSTTSTVTVLAAISPRRDSGVAPSRLSTPYRRSKPVPMAWLVNAVDITASARMPGTTKSIRLPAPTLTRFSCPNAISSSTGMIRVSSSCSPLRASVRSSSPACARTMRGSGAAPGAGAGQSARASSVMTAAPVRSAQGTGPRASGSRSAGLWRARRARRTTRSPRR